MQLLIDRFIIKMWQSQWQWLEAGIPAECIASVIFFLLVMEMILRSFIEDTTLMTLSLNAVDVTLFMKTVFAVIGLVSSS